MRTKNSHVQGDYPNLWNRGLIQPKVKARANHRCEHCGMEFHPDSNLAVTHRNKNGKPAVGTVHHINMNKADCSMKNLVFLCQSCHYTLHLLNWIPAQPLPKQWHNQPPRWITTRCLPYQPNPQKSLFQELNP